MRGPWEQEKNRNKDTEDWSTQSGLFCQDICWRSSPEDMHRRRDPLQWGALKAEAEVTWRKAARHAYKASSSQDGQQPLLGGDGQPHILSIKWKGEWLLLKGVVRDESKNNNLCICTCLCRFGREVEALWLPDKWPYWGTVSHLQNWRLWSWPSM